jgi:hypothetical protein
MNFNEPIISTVLKAVFFPLLFQTALISFAWGSGDQSWSVLAKRLFLLLPSGAILLACWVSIASVVSIPIRRDRHEFITALFVTWWDLGKSILSFWGGMFRFAAELFMAVLAFSRVVLLGAWALVHDVLLLPFNFLRQLAGNVVRSPIPWIAVSLTIAWCIVETTIFTYVMSPVVIDTFSNITGETMREGFIRAPLFLFLFFVVMGSYAVLSTFVNSIKSRSLQQIAGIVVIECIVIFVEVVFLYREFVDSLVPWFAQYSNNFELGIFWTLAVSCFVWFGIRSLSWFLFAAHGTPTIMAVIQGRGVEAGERISVPGGRLFDMSEAYWDRLRQDSAWIQQRRESLLASFMLPPLQVVAAAMNFCTLCLLNKHMFSLPFENLEAMKYSEKLIRDFKKRSGFQAASSDEPVRKKSKVFNRELDPESMTVSAGKS